MKTNGQTRKSLATGSVAKKTKLIANSENASLVETFRSYLLDELVHLAHYIEK